MNNKIIGIGILILVIAGAIAYQLFFSGNNQLPNVIPSTPKEQKTLTGFIGGEKIGFLEDQEIQHILKNTYGITINYTKAGSIEMVKQQHGEEVDFLWPSSQVALELFKLEQKQRLAKSEIIFNSPIVLYSWDQVTEALIKQGIVKKTNESYYIVDFPKLISLVREKKQWSDIGLTNLYGSIKIISTNPTQSNSGNMFSGLLANMLNNGEVANEQSIQPLLPDIQDFFKRLGYLEHSSGDLFEQYLKTGMGAKPIIVGYESQITEFSLENPDIWPRVKDKVRILYPEPTVWSSHPLIILNSQSSILIEALQDKDIQRLAWEKHGFRTGLVGVQNDPKVLEVAGIPETVEKIIPMPNPKTMDIIINALEHMDTQESTPESKQ